MPRILNRRILKKIPGFNFAAKYLTLILGDIFFCAIYKGAS